MVTNIRLLKVFALLVVLCGTLHAQTPDTIVKLGGRKIPVYIKNITATTVYYAAPDKPNVALQIARKDLEKAIFKSGRVETFSDAPLVVLEEGEWQTVLITKKKSDIEGLYKRKEINAETPGSSKARDNALIKLKKQAANVKGTYVLITKEEKKGEFGDLNPGYYIEGIAYGPEPLEEGTDVINDNKKDKTKPDPKKK